MREELQLLARLEHVAEELNSDLVEMPDSRLNMQCAWFQAF